MCFKSTISNIKKYFHSVLLTQKPNTIWPAPNLFLFAAKNPSWAEPAFWLCCNPPAGRQVFLFLVKLNIIF